jgi:hypothetical protein
LCGTTVVLKQLLFVEELDLLALALDGRFRVLAAAPLRCGAGAAGAAADTAAAV